jgi:hypothetical protein
MGGNLAVIEVKPATAAIAAVNADIEKLLWYSGEPASYYCPILIVYGNITRLDELWNQIQTGLEASGAGRLVLFRHGILGRPLLPLYPGGL